MVWSWQGETFFRLLGGGGHWTENYFHVFKKPRTEVIFVYFEMRRAYIFPLFFVIGHDPKGWVGGHNPTVECRFRILWWCSHFEIIYVRNRNWQVVYSTKLLEIVWGDRIARIVILLTWTNEGTLIIFLTFIRWRVYFQEAPDRLCALQFLNNACVMLVRFFQRLYSAMLKVVCFVISIRALHRSVNFVII
jgi:hypothetical protein